jgi:hypothetical protein
MSSSQSALNAGELDRELREGELERDVRGLREALDPNESTLMMAA